MDSLFIETALCVAQEGSFAAAARRLRITPATTAQRIRVLEGELAVTLFTRAGKTVSPTEECRRLLPYFKDVLAAAGALHTAVRQDDLEGEVRLGVIGSMMRHLLPHALASFRSKAPKVRAILSPGHSYELYEGIVKGRLDLAVLIAPPFDLPKSLEFTELRREALMVVLPEAENRRSMDAALRSLPHIQYDPHSWGGAKADQFLADKGITPNIFCRTDVLDAAVEMVGLGLGVALLPDWLGADKGAPGTIWHPAEGKGYERRIIALRRKTSAVQQAVDLLTEELAYVARAYKQSF